MRVEVHSRVARICRRAPVQALRTVVAEHIPLSGAACRPRNADVSGAGDTMTVPGRSTETPRLIMASKAAHVTAAETAVATAELEAQKTNIGLAAVYAAIAQAHAGIAAVTT